MTNYDDVLLQLRAFGLLVKDRLEIGRFKRCFVIGDREKRGWYILHEVTGRNNQPILVGSYGIWQGNEQNAQKITYEKSELTKDQIAAIKKRMAEDRRRADAEQRRRAESAARRAESLWRKLPISTEGEIDYLVRKAVNPFGVRFTDKHAIAIPLLDVTGRIHGLQFILDRTHHKDQIKKNSGRDKIFWPPGLAKKGHFFLSSTPSNILLVAEGYATFASLIMATGLPVALAFDANNIGPVVEAIKKQYRRINILICADDDRFARCFVCKEPVYLPDHPENCPSCKEPHKRKNAGVEAAKLVTLQTDCHWITPKFTDEKACLEHYVKNRGKQTDFNDLHLQDGLHTVRMQVEAALDRVGWVRAGPLRGPSNQGEGGKEGLTPLNNVDEMLERFSLIYGMNGTVFDHHEHLLLKLTDMRDACQSRDIHRRWQESPARRIERVEAVGFDPSEQDNEIHCNLWSGWPTQPKAGKCTLLLDLLGYMCNGESGGEDLYQWVMKWLAYPIQHPGAKMRTCLVIHGPQGTGKNLFFESIMSIYGKYGGVVDQMAVVSQFNEWASHKLFMIADEVVARSDIYHIKNTLKNLITGVSIRINPKNIGAYVEKNHMNLVFLSNETMPVVLEEDDRRHVVVWTPETLSAQFYKDVAEEIQAGGIAALHDALLNLDLSGFNEHSKPPSTQAKHDLINLGKDNVLRFYDDWIHGEIDGVKPMPVLTEDIYELYRLWCGRQNVRPVPYNRAVNQMAKRPGVVKDRRRYLQNGALSNQKYFLFPPGGEEMSPGDTESIWLGDCVSAFRFAMNDYRSRRYEY